MESPTIVVRGAREHNLKNIDLEFPRNRLIVFTGVSGSGKSSLAFDTLYAEGQRRYVESLSNYARQFLGQLPKPDVDYIGGLAPAISIQQKAASRNPRSTVGTVTEVSDYFRVLFARIGVGHCPVCQKEITAQSREQIIHRILALPDGCRFLILAPVIRGQKGEFKDLFADMLKRGYVRARVDGRILRMTDDLQLDKRIKHSIEIVIDRLKLDDREKLRPRLAEAVEQALALGDGSLLVSIDSGLTAGESSRVANGRSPDDRVVPETGYTDLLLSSRYACTACGISYDPPTPQLFSFNSPQGMCPTCDGLGTCYSFAEELLIPDDRLSFAAGAVVLLGPLKSMGRWRRHIYEGIGKTLGIDLKQPWRDLPEQHRRWLLDGSGEQHIVWEWKQRGGSVWKHGGKWEGIIPQLMAQFKKTTAGPRRRQLEKYMRHTVCPDCHGQRLNPQARAVRIGGLSLIDVGAMPIGELVPWLERMEAGLSVIEQRIAGELLKEIRVRLGFLLNVGLHYLTLDRPAPTLSGGEAQRIRLAGQIGSGLVGVLYILDEPSIGLHPRDNERLLRSLEKLRDMGNTVLVVEHDEETMRAADFLVDFGPGPGARGGEIVAAGTPNQVLAEPRSLTGQYLIGKKTIPIPEKLRSGTGEVLRIVNARQNNLKNITVEIPLGKFVCVTGVSGSGKSSLVNDVLKRGLKQLRAGSSDEADEEEAEEAADPGVVESSTFFGADRIDGVEAIDKVIDIDQSPIGRTPRSNPATYIKVWDEIRSLYAQMPEAKVRGYQPGRFSFNRPGGRCEHCEGNGANKLEMDFLADVWVTCPVCEGRRFNRETLQVKYRGKSIHDILELEVAQALEQFEHVPRIRAMLQTLHDVGLDYIKLGQPSPTLSGGEAQRVKLAKELCRRDTGKTLYILDEPTTGLHFEDIRKLLEVLHGFVDAGNTVLVIEHNLDVIKTADWIIDLGPEGGEGGGRIVTVGTPEAVARCAESYTGQALAAGPFSSRGRGRKSARTPAKPRKLLRDNDPERERMTQIEVHGACQHNLKNVSVRIPREAMSVFCGPSGSGKSSLAMDTIYAEGQRRYVESLSSYARQFLGQMQKPKVEQITGLSPAIAIEQKTTSKSPRSTVGTITEIYDYLRILYARLGQRYCPQCRIPVGTQTTDEIIERILSLPEGSKVYVLAPITRKGNEKYEAIFDEIRRAGFVRVRIDQRSYNLEEVPAIDHRRKHTVEVIVDRNVIRPGTRTRIAEAVEQALELGRGVMHLAHVDANRDEPQWRVDRFSRHLACEQCGRSFEVLNPHHYSFNSPLGWCPTCEGLGVQRGVNPSLLIRDVGLSLRAGAIAAWPSLESASPFLPFAEALSRELGFSLDAPYCELEPTQQRAILHGTGDVWIALPASDTGLTPRFQYKGIFPAIDEASRVSFVYRQRLDEMVDEVPCSTCQGSRLRADAAATRFSGMTLGELCALPLGELLSRLQRLKLSQTEQQIIGEVLREITARLSFLVQVGLDYLSLDRAGPTLSGGEAQRIRLASQIGSGLTGVLYILDEPTIGLHPRDNARLLAALHRLRDLGNTLILVEHDREVIAAADRIYDFGPGAGDHGGEITATGTPDQVGESLTSLTGQYLSGRKAIPVPTNRRISPGSLTGPPTAEAVRALAPQGQVLSILGARQHNLKNIDVHFPLGAMIAVTGVSGSGKSSLINEVLYNTLARRLHRARTVAAAHNEIRGLDQIDKIIRVDQDPIGNAPSSNPATYTGVFDLVRELFAQLPESKVRGYHPRRFSFNQKGGRCEACEGNGQKKIEMHFLPDVWVECDVCHGKRYNPETLAVRYHGKSIADVLDLRISEASTLFANIPKIRRILQTLIDVGLGYMTLGQPAPTMSGGEAQRVKLAAELARPSTGRTLYLLDEPTTGLHFDDIRKLLEVLHRLVDLGNTVIVVEHNLDVIKTVDWVIDLGPEAGSGGGQIVVAGTPEHVAVLATARGAKALPVPSHTGRLLAEVLAAGPHEERPRYDPTVAFQQNDGDLEIHQVGAQEKMPWERDGPGWHTRDRVTSQGKPCKWDGIALAEVVDQIHALGAFSPTNWNHRSVVEIAAPVKSRGWFLHALTGHEGYLTLVFRVGKNRFRLGELISRLRLKPLADYPGWEHYSRQQRIQVSAAPPPWQEISITVVKAEEIRSPAFQEFLRDAVASFQEQLTRRGSTVENHMPWKRQGQDWHLGMKGFPPGKPPRWEPTLLPRWLEMIRKVAPTAEFRWDLRDAVTIKLPGINRIWICIKTKETQALLVRLISKPGQFNLARLEGIGHDPQLRRDKMEGVDLIELQFVRTDHCSARKISEFLKEHLHGFQEFQQDSSEQTTPPDPSGTVVTSPEID